MTDKETEVQEALGTLPLWRKIELGEIDIEERPLTYLAENGDRHESSGPTIRITLDLPDMSEYMGANYNKDLPGDRDKALKRLAQKAKKLNLTEDE